MKRLLIDQAARAFLDSKYQNKNYYYNDLDAAAAFLNFIVEKIEEEMSQCPSVTDGVCAMWWRHDGCYQFMSLLYKWTENPKYLTEQWS